MRYVVAVNTFLGLGLSVALFAGCTPAPKGASEIAPEITSNGLSKSSFDVNLYPVTKTVCDPWGDTPDPRSNQGLISELWWLEAGTPKQNTVAGMIANGKKSDRKLFFSSLNVPTRMFNLGFASETGDTVKADDNSTLIEYFALKFSSILKLAPTQPAAMYEFAILSDDGAVMKFRDSDGVYRTNVNNDGDHPTRLGCGATPVAMNSETEIPMSLEYYQGPRYHISLIVLMREYKADRVGNINGKDPACGVTGNDTWFNPNSGSAPKKAYQDLLARGWAPLTKDNYALSNQALFNPCKDGVAPVVTNFQVLERFNDGFVVSWTTDIPATSSVVVTNTAGSAVATASDNMLRTSHLVRTTGQLPNTLYKIQAVSISDSYGRTITPQVEAITDF